MKLAWTLAQRDWNLYLNSAATYVLAVVFLFLTGWLFVSPLFQFGQSTLDTFLRPLPLLFTFLIPALCMRAYAEEYRGGTIEYLGTLPIDDWQIVAGKFLAVFGLIGALLAFTLIYPVILLIAGRPDLGQLIGGYLAVGGLACFYASIGLWASSLTRNQVVAFIIGFFTCFLFFLLDRFAGLFPAGVAGVINLFSVEAHFSPLARGVVDTRDVLFWVGGSVVFLVACLTALQARRLR